MRIHNFNPGPSTLPEDVLKTAKEELLDYRGSGMSVMELSHRSPQYEEINDVAMALLRKILGLGDDYHVLFMGGGASTQFALVPMNLRGDGRSAAYVDTGTWSSKAIKEARKLGETSVVASSEDRGYSYIPDVASIRPSDCDYLHVTSNNTIYGTQYHDFPRPGDVPVVCDMSSDIACRRLEYSRFSMIYAGAQKNLGPAGVTIVAIRKDLLDRSRTDVPSMFSYRTHAEKKSLYNTPPVFAVYLVKLVLEWIEAQGGIDAVEKTNRSKKDRFYETIDANPDYFRGTADEGSRSWMNVTLRLPSEELEKKFIAEAAGAGFVGLKGHRSVGGIRVSLYNAMTLEGAEQLVGFMEEFRRAN